MKIPVYLCLIFWFSLQKDAQMKSQLNGAEAMVKMLEANESSYAVLRITTSISVGSYRKYPLTEVDQDALVRPLTKFNTVIKQAIAHRGPTLIDIITQPLEQANAPVRRWMG